MEKTAKDLMRDIFNASVESIRAQVRDGHMYGCDMNGKEDTILHWKPRQWCNKAVNRLEKMFLKRCMDSQLIIGNADELRDAFNELMQE